MHVFDAALPSSDLSVDSSNGVVSVRVISSRPNLAKKVIRSLRGLSVAHYNGANARSFSSLVNSTIDDAPQAQYHIIVSDKCFPSLDELEAVYSRLRMGYGLVCAYRFACFGLSASFLQRVGYFDESFPGGGREDSDLQVRSFEADVAIFTSEASRYFPMRTSWDHSRAEGHFKDKWEFDVHGNPKRREPTSLDKERRARRPDGADNIPLLPWSYSSITRVSWPLGEAFRDPSLY